MLHLHKPDLDSTRLLVASINRHLLRFLQNPHSRTSLHSRCSSALKIEKQGFFEFSEQSVLSNLYWGIDCVEAAIGEICPKQRRIRLDKAEEMLQIPALLDEHGFTAGIANSYLVCCSYFYLCVVRKLQSDDWQVALHFLQALLVSPTVVRTELAPELCESLFPVAAEIGEEAVVRTARRYKDWLVYYQVMLYGEAPHCHGTPPHDLLNGTFASTESSNTAEQRDSGRAHHKFQFEKVHPLHSQDNVPHGSADKSTELQYSEALGNLDQVSECRDNHGEIKTSSKIKCLQDILNDSDSDTPTSADLHEIANGNVGTMMIAELDRDNGEPEKLDQKLLICSSKPDPMCRTMSLPLAPQHPALKHDGDVNSNNMFSSRYTQSISELNLSLLEISNQKSYSTPWKPEEVELFHHIASSSNQRTAARKHENKKISRTVGLKDSQSEIQEVLDKAVSKLCFSNGSGKCQEDYFAEVKIIYEMLNCKAGGRYEIIKDTLLDQLLTAISTSREEGIVRASVSILTTIISENKSVIEDIKKKGLQLCDLATALKRNVYEAATLIYLINPSPSEIKTLEVLPTLVEVVCTSSSYNNRLPQSLQLTPPTASLMIIEVLVTAFDYDTNNMHLAAINSPRVLCALVHVAKKDNLEEFISLATILVKCMQFDGQSRKYISEFTPMGPFICLLQSNNERAKFIALEFFHEILRMPRSSAISLLQRIQSEGNIDNIMDTLMQCVRQLVTDYQLLAANLLLQLDTLDESSSRITLRGEAIQVLLKSVASEESPNAQLLSTFILSNLGGTFAWTGEPYTVAWLVKKAGLTSLAHRNMIRNFDWLDKSLLDSEIDIWCSKIAKSIIHIGIHVFHALGKGLKSKIKRVSADSLTAIAWLGCEIRKSPNNVKFAACEILLSGLEQYLHPGLELEERLLACLCIYNYTSGKGMQKVIHFSEGVRESLRRFSNVTWMAEELHKVADYILPNKSRISCVHTQILEASQNRSGAVCALIYYKGLLYSGYSDGSIKAWDVKSQSAKLMWNIKEHRRAVTCFSLFEPGESLLSGSADKTIRVWKMVQRKLECTEVIKTKDPVQKLDSYGDMIFVKTQGHSMKVLDSSRKSKDICLSKKVKCMKMYQGKIYVGCADSSIQELVTAHNREREIKAPAKSWMMQSKPINSIVIYKDWLYSASSIVEGSNVKEWRRHSEPQVSIRAERRASVEAMGVVEDFIYLHFSSSPTILQIWLRSTGQKVGRLSAGSKITSLLTANDIILCGTETGLIKGWIPL